MISFTVTTKFKPDDRAYIEGVVTPLTHASRLEPGCLTYIPHWVQGEPATLVIYEQYTDRAALDAHEATSHFAEYVTRGLDTRVLSREHLWLDAIV